LSGDLFAELKRRTADQAGMPISLSDSALAALPDLLKVPADITAAELHLDTRRDPLRNDPRFQSLLGNYPAGEKEAAKCANSSNV
jgi:hypothetical protein